ncbi:MAG: hypothetical protein DRG83_04480 [Deltaproteobacteria bacterium]|nr:MAG: hypothetical protein DRG83_04480 [Deltaproteobacteria bacterium]
MMIKKTKIGKRDWRRLNAAGWVLGYRMPGDLAVWERDARSGRPTFALGDDQGGRSFPNFFITDSPLWAIRAAIRNACRGARILRRAREKGIDIPSRFSSFKAAWEAAELLGEWCHPLPREKRDYEDARIWASSLEHLKEVLKVK